MSATPITPEAAAAAMQQQPPTETPPLATARAGVVIQVEVGGQSQIYDLPTAFELCNQLITALAPYQTKPNGKAKRQPARKKAPAKKRATRGRK